MMQGIAGPRAPGPKYGQPVLPNLNVRQICPNCRTDPPNIIEEYSKGDLVCADCGTILGDRIVDTRSEWRTFAGDEGGDDPSRVGDVGNPLLGVQSFDTVISSRDGRTGMSKDLQRAQQRSNNQKQNGHTSQSTLSSVFAKISDRCESMSLPQNVVTRAQHVYKIVDDKRIVKGKNENVVIAACIIYASRDASVNRSFNEVCKVMGINKKELGQVFALVKTTVINHRQESGQSQSGPEGVVSNTVEGLLGRYVNYLNLGNTIFNAAKHIAVEAEKKAEITGRTPMTIAAGVLYLTCVLFEKEINSKVISDVASVTDGTVKMSTKRIALKLDQVIRPEWKEAHPNGYEKLASMARVNENVGASRSGTPKRSATPSEASALQANGSAVNGVTLKEESVVA